MTSGMACYLYRRCKCVAYGIELYFNAYDSYGLPTGNHVSTCGPKPPYNFKFFFFYLTLSCRPKLQYYNITCTYERV